MIVIYDIYNTCSLYEIGNVALENEEDVLNLNEDISLYITNCNDDLRNFMMNLDHDTEAVVDALVASGWVLGYSYEGNHDREVYCWFKTFNLEKKEREQLQKKIR